MKPKNLFSNNTNYKNEIFNFQSSIFIIIISLFTFNFSYSQDVTLSFGNLEVDSTGVDTTGTIEILMQSSEDVYGFQFNITGVTILSAEAGGIVPGDWMISASDDLVLGFSLMATYIPAGEGVLVYVTGFPTELEAICIENGVVSGAGGSGLTVGYGDCFDDGGAFVTGCDDMDADNYDPDADGCNEDDPSDFSCCDYGGDDDQVTLSFGNFDDLNMTMEILIENSEDVYGFQFDITGVDIISATGGEVVPGDWMISASGSTVLGFSLSGTSFPAGSGVLLDVTYENTGGDICIEGGVISGEGGSGLTVGYGDCVGPPPEPSQVDLSFSGYDAGVVEVSMTNSVDVAGFQLEIISNDLENLEVVSVSGGTSAMYFDMVTVSNPDEINGGRILGFSVSGSTVPSGSDVLMNVEISFEGESGTVEFAGVQFSDSEANALTVNIGGPMSVNAGPSFTVGCNDMDATNYDEFADGCNEEDPSDFSCCDYPVEAHYQVELDDTGEFQLVIFQDSITLLEPGDEIGVFDANGVLESCYPDDGCTDPTYGEVLVGAGSWTGEQLEISAIMSIDLSDFNGPILNGAVDGNSVVVKIWDASEEMEHTVQEVTWSSGSGHFGDMMLAASELVLQPPHFVVDLMPTGEFQLVIFEDTISLLEPGDEIGIFDANGVLESCYPDDGCTDPTYGEVLVGAGSWTGGQLEVSAIMSVDLSDFDGPVLNGAVDGNAVVIKVWKAGEEMEYATTVTWSTGSGHFGDMILTASELEIQEEAKIAINEFFFRAASGTSVPDYVEIVNFGEEDVDLTGWTLSGETLSGTIAAGGYLLVAGEDPFFNADADELYTGEDIPNSIFVDISLGTSAGELVLVDADGNLVDFVDYDADFGWMVGNENRGHALELINPTFENSDPENWLSVDESCISEYLYGEDGSDEDITNFGSPTLENCNYEGEPEPVFGCTDETACNFDPEATDDDGSCEFPEECNDCFGDCICEVDCSGVCGGEAAVDDCGECEGDNSTCTGCIDPEAENYCNDCTIPCDDCCEYAEIDPMITLISPTEGETIYAAGVEFFLDANINLGDQFVVSIDGEQLEELYEGDSFIIHVIDFSSNLFDSQSANIEIQTVNVEGSPYDNPESQISIALIFSPPEEFFTEQSTFQAFYFLYDATSGGLPLEYNDWIGAYCNDTCVGNKWWYSEYTEPPVTVPAFGNDGGLPGYCQIGDEVSFRMYDNSESSYYEMVISSIEPEGGWSNFGFYTVDSLYSLVTDCNGEVGGGAYFDDCGFCCDGETGVECSYYTDESDYGGAYDCTGVCDGVSVEDECNICDGSNYDCTDSDNDCICSGCTDSDANNFDPDVTIDDGSCEFEGSGEIDENGGTVSDGEGSVTIPPGALPENVEITVSETSEEEVPQPPIYVDYGGPVFEFTPHGLEFDTLVTISIPYDENRDDYVFLRLENEEDMNWEIIDNGIFFDGIASLEVSSFSFYAVGTFSESDSWSINITGSLGEFSDNENTLGASESATEWYDAGLDIAEPPLPPNDYLSIYFPHPEWEHFLGDNFTSDIKPLVDLTDQMQHWTLEAASDQEGLIYFNYSFNELGDTPVVMYDTQTDNRVFLNDGDTHVAIFDGETQSYIISVGDITPPSVTMNYPNGGELLNSGDNVDISWNVEDGSALHNMVVSISINGGDNYTNVGEILNPECEYYCEFSFIYTFPDWLYQDEVKVQITAEDWAGNSASDESDDSFIVNGDNAPPVVNLIYPVDLEIFVLGDPDPVIIHWEASDNYLVEATTLYFISNGGEDYVELATLTGEAEYYEWFITDEYFGNDAQIGISATDPAGNTGSTVSGEFIVTTDIQSAEFNAGWYFIGAPLSPYNSDVNAHFVNGTLWSYEDGGYSISESIYAGEGYWLAADEYGVVDISGDIATNAQYMSVSNGWNLITDPFIVGVNKSQLTVFDGLETKSWNDAAESGWLLSSLYSWDGSGSTDADELEPWTGYWVGAMTELEIIADYHTVSEPERDEDLDGWRIHISAETESGIYDNTVVLGMEENATDEFDIGMDIPSPPLPPFESVCLRLNHSEWEHSLGDYYARDIRELVDNPEAIIWSLNGLTPDNITLSWSFENIPEGMSIALWLDGSIIDMQQEESIDLTIDEFSEFQITVGEMALFGNSITEYSINTGANLGAFTVLPEDANLVSIFGTPPIIQRIIGESEAAIYIPSGNYWTGSLQSLSPANGYWSMAEEEINFNMVGFRIPSDHPYELHINNNLISYPLTVPGLVGEVISDEIEPSILAFIGESEAAYNLGNGEWVGSLDYLEPNGGYWVFSTDPVTLIFEEPMDALVRVEDADFNSQPSTPESWSYDQSTEQAFYFIEDLKLKNEDLETVSGYWLLAYCGDVLSGSQQWGGSYTDIPVMGMDERTKTVGYCEVGETPSFKLHKDNSSSAVALIGDIPEWSSNGLNIIILSEEIMIPEEFALLPAYPNPFNPVTELRFQIPVTSNVTLQIFDIQGRMVTELINGELEPGYHQVQWFADNQSTGIYFVQLSTESYMKTQKIMLIK